MRIEVICTGDEVLTGKIINTNFSYMSQKLEDVGLAVHWETTVGDDRESLLLAFKLAGERADAVIVNGGLGPTVDDLSQEVAAQAAGVELALNEEWLATDGGLLQAAQPQHAAQQREAGHAAHHRGGDRQSDRHRVRLRARHRPRPLLLHARRPARAAAHARGAGDPADLAKSGVQAVIHLKRFHSYGLGESHVDALLTGVEEMVPDGSVKLGFRAHYPQLETKLTMRGADMDDIRKKLAPVESEVRKRLGNFILAEDDKTLEGVVLAELASRQGTLAIAETFTSGQIAARIGPLPGAEKVFRRGVVSREVSELLAAVGLTGAPPAGARPARPPRRWHRRCGGNPERRMRWPFSSTSTRARTGSNSAGRSASRSRRRMPLSRGGAASSAAASGCGSAPSRWGSIACAASSRGSPSTRGSISRRRSSDAEKGPSVFVGALGRTAQRTASTPRRAAFGRRLASGPF